MDVSWAGLGATLPRLETDGGGSRHETLVVLRGGRALPGRGRLRRDLAARGARARGRTGAGPRADGTYPLPTGVRLRVASGVDRLVGTSARSYSAGRVDARAAGSKFVDR